MRRHTRTWIAPVALAVGLALVTGQAVRAQSALPSDPTSVLLAFEKSVGIDIDGGLALVADDAVLKITPPPQGTTGLWTGKDEIRQALQYSKDHLVRREVVGTPQVNGNKVTDSVMVTNDFFQHLGVAPVQFSSEAIIESGKIKSLVTVIAPSEQGRVAAAVKAAQTQPAQTSQADPVSVYLAFAKAVGTADIEGTLAMVTDDVVLRITPPPPGTPGVWTGKAEIRQALEYARDHNVTHEFPAAPQADGNKVTATAMLSNSFFQEWGVAPVQFASEAIVENGKIKSFTNTIAPSEIPRVSAAARAYQAAQSAPHVAGMPRTGAGDLASRIAAGLLLMMGLCLVLVGAAVRRAHPSRGTRTLRLK